MWLLRSWPILLLIGLPVAGAAAFAAGLAATDYLEKDNTFCIACHLSNSQRLHQGKYTTFFPVDGAIITLAAAHHRGSDTPFRCVDCHNGTTFADKLRIKAQAARDTVAYFLSDFEEPEQMRFSLGNRLCLKCHIPATKRPKKAEAFHSAKHHRQLPFVCYECHTAHRQAKSEMGFLKREIVQPLCDRCHAQLQ